MGKPGVQSAQIFSKYWGESIDTLKLGEESWRENTR